MSTARVYLRASAQDQDATRARAALDAFAREHGLKIAARYIENVSGATLARPQLFRLLDDSHPGDVILLEQVDRLTRLSEPDWQRLRREIEAKQVRIVALDLPTSWAMTNTTDEFTGRLFTAMNSMMLDILAAIARKDYQDRRRRQAEGITRLKEAGGYAGRPVDQKRHAAIAGLLTKGVSWAKVMDATGCSRATVATVAAKMREGRVAA